MKQKLKYLVIVFLLFAVTIATGCSLSEEEEKTAKEYQEQAEKNAVEYIKEKYGFDAKAIDSDYNREGMFGDIVSSYVDVEMEYDGERFDVYILGNTDWESADDYYKELSCDNYQYEDIYKELKKYLEDATDLDIEEAILMYNKSEDSELEHMTDEYFDGDIERFMALQEIRIELITTDIDYEKLNDVNLGVGRMKVISYDQDYYEKNGHVLADGYLYKHVLWVNWIAEVEDSYVSTVLYEKHEFEFGYVVSEKGSTIDISKTKVDESNWEGNGFTEPEAVSDAYHIESCEDELYLFVDYDNIDEHIAIEYEDLHGKKYEEIGTRDKGYLKAVLDMDRYYGEVNMVILAD